ncbi:MAG: AE-binding protein [Clostridiales bacterium]|nr:AE-binding protein [Clostridiales bacterium]
MNLDYDFNTEYGDGDIPEIDKPKPSNATNVIPDEVPRRDGPGGE